ncbi:collagen alpha-1(I) chain-like [Corvus hawaiiensis]|uniref:collagen alpha-1(I) chain-like n=1 Tax=Corvus hawaiiensis TaxID=134902 RepID=UPI0020189CC3|nr:collagen alpha-1(I) chain-like [Corvus hawaiiensis]
MPQPRAGNTDAAILKRRSFAVRTRSGPWSFRARQTPSPAGTETTTRLPRSSRWGRAGSRQSPRAAPRRGGRSAPGDGARGNGGGRGAAPRILTWNGAEAAAPRGGAASPCGAPGPTGDGSRAGPRGGVTAARRRRALSGSRGGSQRSPRGLNPSPRPPPSLRQCRPEPGRAHPRRRPRARPSSAAAPPSPLSAGAPPTSHFRSGDWAAAEISHERLALNAVNPGTGGGRTWTRRCAVRGWLSRRAPVQPRPPPRSLGAEARDGRRNSRFRGASEGQRPCGRPALALGAHRRRAAPGGEAGSSLRCRLRLSSRSSAALSVPGRTAQGLMGAVCCPAAGGARGLRKERPGWGRRVTGRRLGDLCPLRERSRAVTPGLRSVTVGNSGCVPCLGEYGIRREAFPLSLVIPYCRQDSRAS